MNDRKILVFVGRDDWQKDANLNLALHQRLSHYKIKIIWEDSASAWIFWFKEIEKHIYLPNFIKRLNLRVIQIAYGLLHLSYFRYLYLRRGGSLLSRCHSLAYRLSKHGNTTQMVVLARSSGGRVASLIADQLGIDQIICLGYPFKHPNQGDEPERYAHLAHLQTPMHIIQGIRDEYGGQEIINMYSFSDRIKTTFIDTDHGFNLDDSNIAALIELIESSAGLVKST